MKSVEKILLFFIFTLSLPLVQAKIDKTELKNRRIGLISQNTQRKLERAHDLLSKDKPKKAISLLNRLIKTTEKRPHEKAKVIHFIGLAYAQDENYKEAIKYLQWAMDLKALDYSNTMSVLYTLSQVNAAMEKYDEALKTLNDWFSLADEPSPDAHAFKAGLLAQKKKYRQALKLVTKAINSVTKPKESWLVLAVAMNYELEKFRDALPFLETLTALHPEKKKYWKQLSAVYVNLEKNPKALATMELANKANYLDKDSEVMNLVSLLIYGGIPLKGARILTEALKEGLVEKNQKNYEILGDAWAYAEELEKALKAYAVSAKMAKDGRIFAKQGRIYLDLEDWKKSVHYLSQALKKGKVKNPQNIYMALGVSQFHLKKFDRARKSFHRAKKISKKLKRQAEQWIAYVEAENPESKDADTPSSEEDVFKNSTLGPLWRHPLHFSNICSTRSLSKKDPPQDPLYDFPHKNTLNHDLKTPPPTHCPPLR